MSNKIIDFNSAKKKHFDKIMEYRKEECEELCESITWLASNMEMAMLLLGIDELQIKDGKVRKTKINDKWYSQFAYQIWLPQDMPEDDE